MALPLHVDPTAEEPLHRQVYESIRGAILDGELRPGDRLPPTRVLAERLSVARATVTQAYDQLHAEGYLNGQQGSGTYVAPLPTDHDPSPPGTPIQLSAWGRRLAAEPRVSLRPSDLDVRFDLRPHRVALDSFPWDAWRAAVDAALTTDPAALASPPAAGLLPLREAIAAHVRRYRSVRCSPDQVIVVSGSQQGLNLLLQLLADPADAAVMEDPGYPTARLALEAHGVTVCRVPVDESGLQVDRLPACPIPRLILVTPSHQEPTGAALSLPRRLALLDYAARVGTVVIEDDYDSEFRFEGSPIESLQGLDRHERVVYAGTFSKSLLPGLRIGFLIVPSNLAQPVVAAKSVWDSGSPSLEQAALTQFLASGEYERHIRRMRRIYRSRRDATIAAFQKHFGPTVQIGQRPGGLNLLVQFDVGLSETEIDARASATGVALRSASAYYAAPPPLPTYLIGFGATDESTIDEAILGLARSIDA